MLTLQLWFGVFLVLATMGVGFVTSHQADLDNNETRARSVILDCLFLFTLGITCMLAASVLDETKRFLEQEVVLGLQILHLGLLVAVAFRTWRPEEKE